MDTDRIGHAFYIESKVPKTGHERPEQIKFIEAMRNSGAYARFRSFCGRCFENCISRKLLKSVYLFFFICYNFIRGDEKMYNVDCYISDNGYFVSFDYDIKNLIDFSESQISTMPETSESSVKIAGRDGDIVLSTNYEPILFNIVCYTEDNLTVEQKIAEENKIKTFLNNIKRHTIKLGIEDRGIYYDVKYSGLLTVVRYPKALKFSIPLKSSSSYGKIIPGKQIIGNDSETSNTIKEVGAKFTILGPATSPSITFNDYLMEFNANIGNGEKLIIDTVKSTVTHIDSLNKKTNQMAYYNLQFPKVRNGTNTLQIISGINDEDQVKVEWNDLML